MNTSSAPPGTAHPASLPAQHVPAPSAVAPVLRTQRLAKTYGTQGAQTRALDGVDLEIHRADSLAIMGPSGCGKTTLLHTLAGILRPTAGVVQYDGTDLASLRDRDRTRLRRSDFGFVFQDGQLLPELSALENVVLPRMLDGTGRRAATGEAEHWLDRLGLQGMHGRRPGQLSGGQAQRVAIARALAGGPSVVFADEPTGALDQATGQAVLQVLVETCRDSGAALVMVTHDAQVAQACRRTVAMRDGRIVQQFQRRSPEAAPASPAPTVQAPSTHAPTVHAPSIHAPTAAQGGAR